jgi:hypothetical protein
MKTSSHKFILHSQVIIITPDRQTMMTQQQQINNDARPMQRQRHMQQQGYNSNDTRATE